MTRPQGEPTHYLPLWRDGGVYRDANGGQLVEEDVATIAPVPAERATVAPPPYEPKAGDRVPTNLGYDVTILAAEPLLRYIPVRFHTPDGDSYGKIHVDRIDRAVQ